ncbi:unnamed protein product, partial [Heterosigma akashiwo]
GEVGAAHAHAQRWQKVVKLLCFVAWKSFKENQTIVRAKFARMRKRIWFASWKNKVLKKKCESSEMELYLMRHRERESEAAGGGGGRATIAQLEVASLTLKIDHPFILVMGTAHLHIIKSRPFAAVSMCTLE